MEEKDTPHSAPETPRGAIPFSRVHLMLLSLSIIIIFSATVLLRHESSIPQETRSRAQTQQEPVETFTLGNSVTDEVSPEVRITSPKDGEVLMDPIKIEAGTGALQVSSVEFWLDNEKESFYSVSETPYAVVVPDLRPGLHNAFVKAVLMDGNVKTSDVVSFRVTPNESSLIKDKGEKE